MKKLSLVLILCMFGCSDEPTSREENGDFDDIICTSDRKMVNYLDSILKDMQRRDEASRYGFAKYENYRLSKKFASERPYNICKEILKQFKKDGETLKEKSWQICERWNMLKENSFNPYYIYECTRKENKR